MSGSDKTEKPTPKRKKKAREDGQIPKSPDISAWAAILGVMALGKLSLSSGTQQMAQVTRQMGNLIADPDLHKMLPFMGRACLAGAMVAAPIVIGVMAIGTLVDLVQAGWPPSFKRVKPKFSKLNVAKGLKRLFSPRSLWELGKSVAKVAIIFFVAWPTLRDTFFRMLAGGLTLDDTLGLVGGALSTLFKNVAIAGLVLGFADYAYQRRSIMKQIKMTKQEVKEEYRNQEGDPLVKSAMRGRARAMSQNRMISNAAQADVVLVNPTHFAVALRYRPERGAPEVIAKGTGFVAQRIRQQAERNDVPIVSDPPLTRTLYKVTDVGRTIPPDLYEAIARVLAFVMGIKQRGLLSGILSMPGVETLLPERLRPIADAPGVRATRPQRQLLAGAR